jgi:hypothetical protein
MDFTGALLANISSLRLQVSWDALRCAKDWNRRPVRGNLVHGRFSGEFSVLTLKSAVSQQVDGRWQLGRRCTFFSSVH